ncbi:outer membrane protein [Oceaniglobus indicus]|uniref:outer membrane protein n=1 Tax=Oceaniglobus indicus TaxID=2047749 RepID=UPI000C1817CD|nr:outer membrane beta-barrel protein [Oceaniglobus indicus]
MKIFATTAIATLIGFPALAGGLNTPQPDPVIQQPVLAPVMNTGDWTGGYVGAQLGYGNLNGDGLANVGGNNRVFDSDGDGALGGVYGGYLYQQGNFVYGGELSLNAANLDFDNNLGSIDQLHQLKFKAGYGTQRTLVYGTIGAAYAKGDIAGRSADDFGYEIGAGIDYMVNDRVSIGTEVTYNKFDDFDNTGIDFDTTTIGANVAYRF